MPPAGKANRLVANVEVPPGSGTWYGPAYDSETPSKEIADQITNPLAWADEGDDEDEDEAPKTPRRKS